MPQSAFQWSDQGTPPSSVLAGANRLAWSDEEKNKAQTAPNAGLAPAANARVTMQPSYVGMASHPEGHILNPAQPAESFALAHPEQQPILRDAAMVGAFPGGVPELIGAGVGGFAGDKSGRFITRAAGGGETAQDIGGTVGGIVGGGIGASRLGGGIRGFVKPILESFDSPLPTSAPALDLDATPGNKPYAGAPRPRAARWNANDATGENKPFAGGMDEQTPPKKPVQSAAAPTTPSRMALPVTELEKPVLGRAAEMTNKYPVQSGALASPERILSPIESTPTQPPANTAEATDWHNQALQMAKEKLGPQAPLGNILQEAAKIQQAGPSVIAPEFSPEAQNILGRLGKNAEQIRIADAARATEPDDLSRMLESPDFIERSVEAVKAKRLAAQKAAIIQ